MSSSLREPFVCSERVYERGAIYHKIVTFYTLVMHLGKLRCNFIMKHTFYEDMTTPELRQMLEFWQTPQVRLDVEVELSKRINEQYLDDFINRRDKPNERPISKSERQRDRST